MSQTTTITIHYPVTINGELIAELKLRRPTVGDRLMAEKVAGTEVDKEVRFLANLCEVTPDTILQLDLKDYAILQEALSDFLS
jgi:hypothetical protein